MLSLEIVQEQICRSKVYVRIYTGIRFIGRAIDILYFHLGEHFTLSHQALSSGFLTYYFGVSSRKYSKTRVQCIGDIPFITLRLSGGFWKLQKNYIALQKICSACCATPSFNKNYFMFISSMLFIYKINELFSKTELKKDHQKLFTQMNAVIMTEGK